MAFGIDVYFISSQFGFCEHVLHPGRYDPQKVPVQSPHTRIDYHGIWNCSIQRVDITCLKVATPKMGGPSLNGGFCHMSHPMEMCESCETKLVERLSSHLFGGPSKSK